MSQITNLEEARAAYPGTTRGAKDTETPTGAPKVEKAPEGAPEAEKAPEAPKPHPRDAIRAAVATALATAPLNVNAYAAAGDLSSRSIRGAIDWMRRKKVADVVALGGGVFAIRGGYPKGAPKAPKQSKKS